MRAHLLDVRAARGVALKAARHEVEGVARDARAGRALAHDDAALDGVRLGREGRVAREEVREQHAERPDLRGRRLVRLLAQDLGGRVRGRAEEERVERCGGVWVRDDGAAEVDEFHLWRGTSVRIREG